MAQQEGAIPRTGMGDDGAGKDARDEGAVAGKAARDAGASAGKGARNEGEGSRSAARAYNEAAERFAKSGKVDSAARDAAKAMEGPEKDELRRAEQEGKRHSHGKDPAVKR
jgi:hypothetical protein